VVVEDRDFGRWLDDVEPHERDPAFITEPTQLPHPFYHGGHDEKVVCEATPPDTKSAGTLTLGVQTPEW
jgi:hypothetical protein